jgi:hypothetical protein
VSWTGHDQPQLLRVGLGVNQLLFLVESANEVFQLTFLGCLFLLEAIPGGLQQSGDLFALSLLGPAQVPDLPAAHTQQ